jgi:hypothetical protein
MKFGILKLESEVGRACHFMFGDCVNLQVNFYSTV